MDVGTFLPSGFGLDQIEDSGDGLELNFTNQINISTADEPESFPAEFDGLPDLRDMLADIPQDELERLK